MPDRQTEERERKYPQELPVCNQDENSVSIFRAQEGANHVPSAINNLRRPLTGAIGWAVDKQRPRRVRPSELICVSALQIAEIPLTKQLARLRRGKARDCGRLRGAAERRMDRATHEPGACQRLPRGSLQLTPVIQSWVGAANECTRLRHIGRTMPEQEDGSLRHATPI